MSGMFNLGNILELVVNGRFCKCNYILDAVNARFVIKHNVKNSRSDRTFPGRVEKQ